MAYIPGTNYNDDGITRPVLIGTESYDSIEGFLGRDSLVGLGGDDWLDGGAHNDTLVGGNGNDTLFGGTGNDSLVGGRDNDTYYVDSLRDTIREFSGEGNDTVIASISDYSLADRANHVENLELRILTPINKARGTGNGLDNKIEILHFGYASQYELYGEAGNDTLVGSGVRDWLSGGDDNDLLQGSFDSDILFGESGEDTLEGGYGGDYLDAGSGDDILRGGDGEDALYGTTGFTNHSDIDSLWGDGDADTFYLGNNEKVGYWRGAGFAVIEDFNPFEDKIQLAALVNRADYSLGVDQYWNEGPQDTGIFYKNNLIGVISGQPDIGMEQDNLGQPYFKYD